MVAVKRVVVYGLVNEHSDHRSYAILGEWEWLLWEGKVDQVLVRRGPKYRYEYRSKRTGRFARKGARGAQRVRVAVPARERATGRYAKPRMRTRVRSLGLPADDDIVAETFRVIEEVTGLRMFRTPHQAESGLDRVTIGTQKIKVADIRKTYSFKEYLAELRHRVENTWRSR